MKIILYGSYTEDIQKNIDIRYISAWLCDTQDAGSLLQDVSRITEKDLGTLEYDAVLISGDNLDKKYMALINIGVYADKIRTADDLCCDRHEHMNVNVYYNELCHDNLTDKSASRVLMIAHDLAESGAPVAFLNMARCLQDMGYHITLYCQCDGPMRTAFIRLGIPVYIENLSDRENLGFWLKMMDFKFAVVNTLLQYRLTCNISASGVKVLWWIHECENYFNSILEIEGKFPEVREKVYPVPVGERVRKCFQDYSMKPLNVRGLLYGVEDRYQPGEMEKNEDRLCFALIGAIQYRKGQDLFIDAIRCLSPDERKKCIFKIIGGNAFEGNELIRYIQDAEKEFEEIEYLGPLTYDDMQRAYSDIDIVVCPSRIDPMPIAATEGFMFHKICLISDMIGTAEYVQDGINGYVAKTGDAMAFAEKMSYIINNPGGHKKIRDNGRKIYDDNFAMNIFYDNLSDLIEEIRED